MGGSSVLKGCCALNDSGDAGPTGTAAPYRGRFAPTPSGPLHLGSLLTAVASFLQARASGGVWLLRIDDLDQPRSRPEHIDTIQRQLEAHGLLWDESVHRQSGHVEDYEQALTTLARRSPLYHCECTRARLAEESLPGPDGPVYSGRCRSRGIDASRSAIRIAVGDGEVTIDDPGRGPLRRDLGRDIGDFVLRRADGQMAYQLASVVDDRLLRITEIVRGSDLIGSSLRQRYLAGLLGYPAPDYRHVPVLVNSGGNKLSKQNHATAILASRASYNLMRCLDLLGQRIPGASAGCPPKELLQLAARAWAPRSIPQAMVLPADA